LEALALARLSLALRLTLDSSMPIHSALGLSLRATGNAAYEAKAPEIQAALRAGDDLTVALTEARFLPNEYVNLIAAAEQGGRVPEVMGQQAKYYEEEAERKLAVLSRVAGFGVWLLVACLIVLAIFRIANMYIGAIDQAIQQNGL